MVSLVNCDTIKLSHVHNGFDYTPTEIYLQTLKFNKIFMCYTVFFLANVLDI